MPFLNKMLKNKAKIRSSLKKIFIFAYKILSAGYFNEVGDNFNQAIILAFSWMPM